MAIRFTLIRRSRRALSVAALTVAACAAGCSERGSGEKLLDNAPLLVSITPTSVTLQNRAGLPLADIKIVIVPYGPVEFAKSFARFETSERREVSLGEFRSADGAALNLRFVRPRSVRVSAKDVVGKSYEVEIPWRQ